LRRSNVGNYAIFYYADEAREVCSVIRIVYGGRDIETALAETPEE